MTDQELQHLKLLFASCYGAAPRCRLMAASAPGRLELAGNHTDHQGGCVISAAIHLSIKALAAPAVDGEERIRVHMEDFGDCFLNLEDPQLCEPHPEERGTSLSLIRGMVAAYVAAGGKVFGFDAVISSDLPAGAGLSSSAAFEMLIGVLLRAFNPEGQASEVGELVLTDDDRIALALQGQDAERRFFGKICGAQDQITSAFGGAVFMDFSPASPAPPKVTRIGFDPAALPYRLVLVDSKVDHSQFTADYDSVPADMFALAKRLGGERLGDVGEEAFLEQGRAAAQELSMADSAEDLCDRGQRAYLRGCHFFEECHRVEQQYQGLNAGDFVTFARLAHESGRSNLEKLCNVTPQSIELATNEEAQRPAGIMTLCEEILGEDCRCRMHGGGFGGSILCLVPHQKLDFFIAQMNNALGYDACLLVDTSSRGASAALIDPELPGLIAWESPSKYGTLELTINLRKPEKDPRAIADALTRDTPCALCKEVANYDAAWEISRDPRIEAPQFTLDGEPWMLHFSPYGYYEHHCIILPEAHRPMAITPECIARLLACVDHFPHFFVGSNADLPIVGGSILAHDHFQGGEHVFPLMKAPLRACVELSDFPEVACGIVNWPASTLRCASNTKDALVATASALLDAWQNFDYLPCEILSHTGDVRHNTITPIAYKQGDDYIIDLVLRNNRTTPERPFGLFHPDESLHHIKKENIGLIEIMGLAILPGRLVRQFPGIEADEALQAEVGACFERILEATGVFKLDTAGDKGWETLLGAINGRITHTT